MRMVVAPPRQIFYLSEGEPFAVPAPKHQPNGFIKLVHRPIESAAVLSR